MRRNSWILISATVLGMAASASAATNTADLAVSATVTTTCSISTTPLAFGNYDPVAGTLVDATATVTVACTQGATATVTLGQGAHAGGGSTNDAPVRRMTSGANALSYALYSDSGRQTVWGNSALTGVGYTAPSNAPNVMTVYGRIGANQNIPAGTYTDTVVATVTF